MKIEVMKYAQAVVQNYTDPETRKETIVRTKLPKMPYLVGAKVELTIGSSVSLPPGLDTGGDGRKLGVRGEKNQNTIKERPKTASGQRL